MCMYASMSACHQKCLKEPGVLNCMYVCMYACNTCNMYVCMHAINVKRSPGCLLVLGKNQTRVVSE